MIFLLYQKVSKFVQEYIPIHFILINNLPTFAVQKKSHHFYAYFVLSFNLEVVQTNQYLTSANSQALNFHAQFSLTSVWPFSI